MNTYTVYIQQTKSVVVEANTIEDATHEACLMVEDIGKFWGDKQILYVEEHDDTGAVIATHDQVY